MMEPSNFTEQLGEHLVWDLARKPNEIPALALAYIGDAVWEVAVRMRMLHFAENKPHMMHKKATRYVKAERQAFALHSINSLLTDEEVAIVKRGRNAKSGSMPKHATVTDYRHSTAFECLLGFLFVTKEYDRLQFIIEQSIRVLEQ
jgi:ribonuclease III family protein